MTARVPAIPAPRPSFYLNDTYYARVLAISREWREMGAIPAALVPPAPVRTACEALLVLEARLIDDDRLEEWLELFTQESLYWIPPSADAPDPRVNVQLEIHDRRRLEDRVARLRSGVAYSQLPPTRTRHLYTNLECWQRDAAEVRARCNFLIATFAHERHRPLAGWMGWVLKREADTWKIEIKQVNYIDCDYPQENNTFTI